MVVLVLKGGMNLTFSRNFARTMLASHTVVPKFKEDGFCDMRTSDLHAIEKVSRHRANSDGYFTAGSGLAYPKSSTFTDVDRCVFHLSNISIFLKGIISCNLPKYSTSARDQVFPGMMQAFVRDSN